MYEAKTFASYSLRRAVLQTVCRVEPAIILPKRWCPANERSPRPRRERVVRHNHA